MYCLSTTNFRRVYKLGVERMLFVSLKLKKNTLDSWKNMISSLNAKALIFFLKSSSKINSREGRFVAMAVRRVI